MLGIPKLDSLAITGSCKWKAPPGRGGGLGFVGAMGWGWDNADVQQTIYQALIPCKTLGLTFGRSSCDSMVCPAPSFPRDISARGTSVAIVFFGPERSTQSCRTCADLSRPVSSPATH